MKVKHSACLLVTILLVVIIGGCSTRRNTAGTRFYHSLTTRYNVYFNAEEAYNKGMMAITRQNKDNYLEQISLYPVDNLSESGAGVSEFSRTIEKAQKAIRQHSIKRKPIRRPGRRYTDEYRRWLNRREFNPYLHKAWMLMGKAQYHKGDTTDAVATFSYIMRLYDGQPDITAEAGIWLSRCYTTKKWYYEASDMLNRIENDSLPRSLVPFHSSVKANLLLNREQYREALPHLLTTIQNEKNRQQRAREYYLLGQVYQQLQEKENAYNAFKKVIRLNPPYELELSARIRQTEVMPENESPQTIRQLRRMARNEKNKDYLDQVYYALGNLFLIEQDTAQAIKEYKQGIEKSTRNAVEKGVLQLRLGNLQWELGRYEEAQKSYAGAIGLIPQNHKGRETLNQRLKLLDGLVTYTTAIHLQDSLQYLASLPEAERILKIEKLIEETTRSEKEKAVAEQLSQRRQEQEGNIISGILPISPTGEETWYFYNPQLVTQGKVEFERNWGRRKLEDNWRRTNKTVIDFDTFPVDSTETTGNKKEQVEKTTIADTVRTDKKSVDYYLKQIPTTAEEIKKSNEILSESLYELGLIYKDSLQDYSRAERTFTRIIHQFPEFPQHENVYYHLYLLSLRLNKPDEAANYKSQMINIFPESSYTRIISDPDYQYNAIHGKHLEDSLYADTYNAWREGNYQKVRTNNELSAGKYPLGKNRPRFIFLHAMSALQSDDIKTFLSELKEVVQKYPQSEITEIAGYILKGIQEGRPLAGSNTPLGSIWQRRNIDLFDEPVAETDSLLPLFSTERQVPHIFILAYEEGKVDENLLLFDIARYNFSGFVIKNFDLEFVHHQKIGMLQVRPFANLDEAAQYSRQLYSDKDMTGKLAGLRAIVISEQNYQLLLKYYSFDDYDKFYKDELASDFINELNLDYIDFEEAEE